MKTIFDFFKDSTELKPNEINYSLINLPCVAEKVTAETALQVPAFSACVQIISETIGMLPYKLIKKYDGKTTDCNFYNEIKIFTEESNQYTTGENFRQLMTASYLLYGNSFAEKEKSFDGSIIALHYINPERCTQIYINSANQIRYVIDGKEFGRDKIFHLTNLLYSKDGFSGKSVLENSKEIIALALAQMRFASAYFNNGATPTALILTNADLTKEQSENFLSGWNKKFRGAKNSGKIGLMPKAVSDIKIIGSDAEKSQLNESRKLTTIEICRLFRMPPHLVQSLDGATFSNIEEQAREFIEYTLMPHVIHWEKSCKQQLLKEIDKPFLNYKFNLDALARGKLLDRYTAHASSIMNGWKSRNEVRNLEDMDSAKDLDEMVRIGNLITNEQTTNEPNEKTEPTKSKSKNKKIN